MAGMGGKLPLARQLCSTPWTGDCDDGASSVVNQQAVVVSAFAVVNEGIGTFKSVRMKVAHVLDVGPHHFTAMLCHASVSQADLMSAMGRMSTSRSRRVRGPIKASSYLDNFATDRLFSKFSQGATFNDIGCGMPLVGATWGIDTSQS